MPRIHVLDKAVAELIAAGEVVERPSSIVKELVENAVDAGATSITVEIRGGGLSYIRIQDNGCGIQREDIPKAFIRHATSKVRVADDLAGIRTLGFRGEALASVAAMCRVELTTKTAEDEEGASYRIEGGEEMGLCPAGCPTGTTILVRDVFFNTPARMKFLKKDVSEGNAVAQVVDKCALSHPEIAFRFIRDNQTKLRTTGGGDLLAVSRTIYGKEFADALLPLDYTYEGRIRVHGYISKPAGAKASRVYQNFFINQRYVRTRTASAALEEAFKNKLMGGKFPSCVLHLEIGADTVDVNVHPAKIEVRFADEKPVFHAVYFGVKNALSALDAPLSGTGQPSPLEPKRPSKINPITIYHKEETPVQQRMTATEFQTLFGEKEKSAEKGGFTKPISLRSSSLDIAVDDDFIPPPRTRRQAESTAAGATGGDTLPLVTAETQSETKSWEKAPKFFENEIKSTETPTIVITEGGEAIREKPAVENFAVNREEPSEESEQEEAADYRMIGEAFATYILLEQGEDLVLVDKHAAHERILYEQLRENLAYGNRQLLLTPLTVTLSREDYDAILTGLDRVEAMGFGVEDFGDGTVLVRETPIELPREDLAGILVEMAGRLRAGNRDLTPEALDRLYYSIACRSAVKGGERNHPLELQDIVERLRKNPQITHCPHGRPVVVRMGRREVEKLFGRLG